MSGYLGSGLKRRHVVAKIVALTVGTLLIGASPAWADEEPPAPSAATHMSLSGNQGEELGSADVLVSSTVPGSIDIEGWIEDTKKDSRCVYVEYKVITAHGHDPDDTLVRVCGQGDRDYKIHRKTQWFFDVHQAVEFTLCREEGAKFVPDPDTCTRSTIAL
jgi:uncharacterized protein YhfF